MRAFLCLPGQDFQHLSQGHSVARELTTRGNTMIKPTIGRVVWYWPTAYDLAQGMFAYPGSDQPMAATVAFVHSDRMVNLSVVDHNGQAFEKRSATLLQDGDVVRDRAGYAEWMPFQKGQTARTEAAEAQLVGRRSGCTCGPKSCCTSCGGPAASITVPPSADMASAKEGLEQLEP